MGTYGLIREAVYIASVPEQTYDRTQFLKKQLESHKSDQKNHASFTDEVISVFDDLSI